MLCLFVFVVFLCFFNCSRFISVSVLLATVCRMYSWCIVSNWFIIVSASNASVLIQLLCLWCRLYFSPLLRSFVSLFVNVILVRFSTRL
jgi:hypothetical protein